MKLIVRIIIMVSLLLLCREGYLSNFNDSPPLAHIYKSSDSQGNKSRRLKAVNPNETEEDDNEDEDDLSFRLHTGWGIELFPLLRQLLLPSNEETRQIHFLSTKGAHFPPHRHILYQVFRI